MMLVFILMTSYGDSRTIIIRVPKMCHQNQGN